MTTVNADALFANFTRRDFQEIMVGAALDVSKLTDLETAKKAALHCVLNGPVGVHKLTSFPGVEGELKLKSLYDGRLSNKMWRQFCSVIAEYIVRVHGDVAASCQQTQLHGRVWPLNES